MELQVTLTLSDRLFGLLENKLPNLGRRIEKALTKEIGAQTRRESTIEVAIAPVETGTESSKPNTPATNETSADPAPQKNAKPTEMNTRNLPVEIREIMHRIRLKFEGEDYKENTASEGYNKYHRALTSQFKQIALALGFEKPSMINVAEKVDAFIAECEALVIGKDGNITPPPAPF